MSGAHIPIGANVQEYIDAGLGGGSGSKPDVTDGSTTVTAPDTIEFVNATVADDSGNAQVTVGGGSQPGTRVLLGPYPVEFDDIPDNEDELELFVPSAGLLLLNVFVNPLTIVEWDQGGNGDGYNLFVGQGPFNVAAENNQFAFWDAKDANNLVDSSGFATFDIQVGGDIGTLQLVTGGAGYPFPTTDPVKVAYSDTSMTPTPPSQGHVDLYFEVAMPTTTVPT